MYVYQSLHVSGNYGPIIRRNNCVYATLGMHSTLHTRQSSTQNNKYHVSQKHHCFSHGRPKHIEIDKYTKNKLCTKLVLFTRLYRGAQSTKHKILAKLTIGGTTPLGYTSMMRINCSLCTAASQHTMFIPVMSPGKRISNDFVCVCVCVVIFFTCEKIRMLCLVAVGLNIKMRCTRAVS